MDGPYRSSPRAAQYVCLVCYRSLSAHPGVCRRCGVERLDLSDPRVRSEVRAEVERRLERRMYREYMGLSLLAFGMALPVNLLVGGLLGRALWVVLTLVLGNVNIRLYAASRPRSALAVFAHRRGRLRRELGVDLASTKEVPRLPARSERAALRPVEADDPEQLDLERTLRWLGASVDDESG